MFCKKNFTFIKFLKILFVKIVLKVEILNYFHENLRILIIFYKKIKKIYNLL